MFERIKKIKNRKQEMKHMKKTRNRKIEKHGRMKNNNQKMKIQKISKNKKDNGKNEKMKRNENKNKMKKIRKCENMYVAGALPCGSCAPSFVSLGSCTSLGSVLVLVVRVRLRCVPHLSVLCSSSWSCLGHPQPPWRTRHGCTVGVNRDPPVCFRCPSSMASVAERQPYVRWRRATISKRRG